jgi:signal transduction histidine kinase
VPTAAQTRSPGSPAVVAAIGARRVAALLYAGPAIFLAATLVLVIGLWKKIDLGGVVYLGVAVLAALGVISALTLRRKLAQVSAALERAQRTTTVGLVTAGFAHEMKNALTVILGFTELARTAAERTADPQALPKTSRHLREVDAEVRRTIQQLQTFLSYAGGERQPRLARDLNALVKESLAMVRPMARMKELLLDDEPGAPPKVVCDPFMVQQLLLNLLLNAIDFAKGRITIRTGTGPGGLAEIVITDDGPGVPEADRERIFQRFVTTRKGGNGLGLTTSREIAEAHGGSLTLGEGPGGVFVVRLPPAP